MSIYFLPCRSWFKVQNGYEILKHEQLHFDISEYYRRLLIKKLMEVKASPDVLPSVVRALLRNIIDEKKQFELDYDSQTRFGALKEVQSAWQQKVDDLLQTSEQYSMHAISLKTNL